MKPSTTIGVPMSGNTVLKPDIITPATPASPEPKAKVSALTRVDVDAAGRRHLSDCG